MTKISLYMFQCLCFKAQLGFCLQLPVTLQLTVPKNVLRAHFTLKFGHLACLPLAIFVLSMLRLLSFHQRDAPIIFYWGSGTISGTCRQFVFQRIMCFKQFSSLQFVMKTIFYDHFRKLHRLFIDLI